MSKGFVFGCFLGVFVLATLQQVNGQGFFRIMNNIPHLPVVDDPSTITSPAIGSIIVSQTCGVDLLIYDGAGWVSACDETALATIPATQFSIKGGIPAIAVDNNPIDITPVAGDAYFSSNRKSFLVYNGSTFVELNNFTGSSTDAGTGIKNSGKLFKIPILASAPTDVQNGAICFKPDGKLQVYYNNNWNELECGGDPFIIVTHSTADGVAPINNTTITYKVVEYDGKCWLAQNLGANQQADGLIASESTRGWFWQFKRKEAWTSDKISNGTWDSNIIDETGHWIDKDPCKIELGSTWRLPTLSEWESADTWNNQTDCFNSVLRLHGAGYFQKNNKHNSTANGYFWSSTEHTTDSGRSFISHTTAGVRVDTHSKSHGLSVRCVKDLN